MKKILSSIAVAIFIFSGTAAYAAMPTALEAKINVLDAKHDQAEVIWERMNHFLDNAEAHGVDISAAHDEYELAKETHTQLLVAIDGLKDELSGDVTPAEVAGGVSDLKDAFLAWKDAMKNLIDQVKEIREGIATA
ncbi:hypothetical protein H6790_00250 [Candidatus Nomurabacteria bacterium]|nr:hypothetical protein [Candidatus Nomurabacteria bacterium]MCB9820366.1 hypothetical protein [Candidatus Nomurabacteria bacterium]